MAQRMPELQMAMDDYYADNIVRLGINDNARLRLGNRGQLVSEEVRDPVRHASVPEPLWSIGEMLTDEEHVTNRRRKNSLDLNIVLHRAVDERNNPGWINASKYLMEKCVLEGVIDAHAQIGNRTFVYGTGDTSDFEENYRSHDIEIINDTERPQDAAKTAADISLSGLTIVMTTGSYLPLHKEAYHDESIVILKTRHLFEMAMQPNTGSYTTGEKSNPTINTADSTQLAAWNKIVAQRRGQADNILDDAGIGVAYAVYDRRSDSENGFNLAAIDTSLARAVHAVKH